MKKCFYEILNLQQTATFAEIKKSYRKLVVKYHPDKNKGSKECEEKLKEIIEAYECLSDTRKRAEYDERVKVNVYTAYEPQEDYATKKVTITLEESYFGCEKYVNVVERNGNTRQMKVTIPRGVSSGATLTVHGNGRFLDFFLNVSVTPHSFFERQGYDLTCRVTIPYVYTLMGGTTNIPWFDGMHKLHVRPGIYGGAQITLSGMGMPVPNTEKFGDLIVTVNVRGLVDFSEALLESAAHSY